MKKSITILTLAIVNLILLTGLSQAGIESNNITISGHVFYKNTTSPVPNAIVKLYFVNSDQISYKVLESVTVNDKGEFAFVSTQLNLNDKVRIGAYVNDIIQSDRISTGNGMQTDEFAELGAYANDLVMDRISYLSAIYNQTTAVDLNSNTVSKTNLYLDGKVIEGIIDDLGGGIGTYPREPIIKQNYPNPFNPTTNIQFGISEQSFVSLKVYDMSGKMVAELVGEVKNKGYYTVKFDGTKLASGFYIYRLTAGDFSLIKKMSLIK